jgi:hypothetical protein
MCSISGCLIFSKLRTHEEERFEMNGLKDPVMYGDDGSANKTFSVSVN